MNISEPNFHVFPDFFVRFSETDAAGLVHFTNFLRWTENAECDFFKHYKLPFFEKTPSGAILGFPRVSVKTDFRAPARYADRIRVKICPVAFPPSDARSIEWSFEIFRIEEDSRAVLLSTGTWTSVFAEISPDGTIRTQKMLPPELLSVMGKIFFS